MNADEKPSAVFLKHLEMCAHCHDNPYGLCLTGEQLLVAAVNEVWERRQARARGEEDSIEQSEIPGMTYQEHVSSQRSETRPHRHRNKKRRGET